MKITTSEPNAIKTVGGLQNCLPHTMYRECGSNNAIIVVGEKTPEYDQTTMTWKNASYVSLQTKNIVHVTGGGWGTIQLERLPDGFELIFTQETQKQNIS